MRYRTLTSSAILTLCLGLSACSSAPLIIEAPRAEQTTQLLALEQRFSITQDDLKQIQNTVFTASPEMLGFVRQHVPSSLPANGRLRYLTDAIKNPRSLGLSYSPGTTLTAAETFEQQQGNCLSMTAMFVAMAKAAGLEAWVNEVSDDQAWDMLSDNQVAIYKHINAVVELDNKQVVVDFSNLNNDYLRPQQRITESRAAAQYFSNRGVESLNLGQLDLAYRYLQKALQLDANTGFIWGNLGTLLYRKGMTREAELAFRKAYTLDNQDHTALANLERLYTATGNSKQAQKIKKVILKKQLNNPYWHYGIARQHYENGELEEALKSALRAIRLDDQQHRFYKFAAGVYRQLGDRDNYHRYGIKAARLKKAELESLQ